MSCPAMLMVPAVGSSRPATIRSVVVLPHPDGPSRAKKRPCSTRRSRLSTAVKVPNFLVTDVRVRSAPACSWAGSVGGRDVVTASGSDHRGELLLVVLLGLLVQSHEAL